MLQTAEHIVKVDAQVNVPIAAVQLVKFQMTTPADNVLQREDACWIDLSLTPRPQNARGRYSDHWSPSRFERLGRLFVLPAGEALRVRSDGGPPQASLLCHLKPQQLQEWFDGSLRWTDRQLEACLDIRENHVHTLLMRLVDELRNPGFASEAMVELITGQLALELSRYCRNVDEQAVKGGLAAWRLRLIDERVNEQWEAPSLTELAELCGLSTRQLTRGFRESRGRSIGDFLAENRLRQSRELLAGDTSIKAIAYTLGFSSPSSFCYAFRRDTGETPGQYRERIHRQRH